MFNTNMLKTSIIVISFFMMEMLKRVRWLALAPFMSVMITIPLMSNWSVHLCREGYLSDQTNYQLCPTGHLDGSGYDHLAIPHQMVEVDLRWVDTLERMGKKRFLED